MFFQFSVKDFIDILLVALMLYYVYRLTKDSGSLKVFIGILIFLLLWLFVSKILEMRLLGAIFDQLTQVGAIALIVIFQEEIRKFLITLGSHEKARRLIHFLRGNKKKETDHAEIMPIVLACMNLAKGKVGALIVIEKEMALNNIIATGDTIDANLNQRLIENIFFKNSPLHDGAMVIRDGRIAAAGCILPVSHSDDIPKELGLRHRAALGISQETDALTIVVSEETGHITIAYKGHFYRDLTAEALEGYLAAEEIKD